MMWTPEQDAQLRNLWDERNAAGRPVNSTKRIAAVMNTTKNAIIGRSHRLFLPSRPSPIKYGQSPKPPTVKAIPLPRLPSLEAKPAAVKPPTVRGVAPVLVSVVVKMERPLSYKPCCWPIGEVRSENFRFCGAATVAGKSYCPEHYTRSLAPRQSEPIARRVGF